MRFSVLTILLLSALASVVSAVTAAKEDQNSHQLRRRRLLNERQATIKVNLAANCQVEATQFCSNISSCVSLTNDTET
jgi:hypothetical protein